MMDSRKIANFPELNPSTLRVEPEGLLDFNAIQVRHLVDEVNTGRYERVVIDLGRTTGTLESGLAMLFLFHQHATSLKNCIYLVNSSLPFREKILRFGEAHSFHFSNCRNCPVDYATTEANRNSNPYLDMCINCEYVYQHRKE